MCIRDRGNRRNFDYRGVYPDSVYQRKTIQKESSTGEGNRRMKEVEPQEKPAKKKRRLAPVLFGLLFLVGFGILAYPTISNQWNTYRQNQLISNYEDNLQSLDATDFTDEWQKAEAFNQTITDNDLYGDVFGEDDGDLKNTDYWNCLLYTSRCV